MFFRNTPIKIENKKILDYTLREGSREISKILSFTWHPVQAVSLVLIEKKIKTTSIQGIFQVFENANFEFLKFGKKLIKSPAQGCF